MDNLTDTQIDDALERGRAARSNEPRATSARFDGQSKLIVVRLSNGCSFAFPPRLAPELASASPEQLSQVDLVGTGSGLHWESLDADLSIPGLLADLFGTRAAMARQAGRSSSAAKATAARLNGAKGGRPRKAGLA